VSRSPDETEEELVERARRGDAPAYEELVQRYSAIAFRTAYVVTGSAAEAQDAAQDAFLKAHSALRRFRGGSPFRPWLLRIVGNEARNRLRAAERRRSHELRAIQQDALGGGGAPSPEAAAEAQADRRALIGALDSLADDQRRVVRCRYLLQLSVEETAVALGIPEGTVKSRLARGLLRLRELLEPPGDG
jgi:RNA polymerase sigma-70 factor (ECF subfamily)